jgi:hypothetical protein
MEPTSAKTGTVEQLQQGQVKPDEPKENSELGACTCSRERDDILKFLRGLGVSTMIEGIYDQDHNICEECTLSVEKQLKREQQTAEARKMALAQLHDMDTWREIETMLTRSEVVPQSCRDTSDCSQYPRLMRKKAMQPAMQQMATEWPDPMQQWRVERSLPTKPLQASFAHHPAWDGRQAGSSVEVRLDPTNLELLGKTVMDFQVLSV